MNRSIFIIMTLFGVFSLKSMQQQKSNNQKVIQKNLATGQKQPAAAQRKPNTECILCGKEGDCLAKF